MAVVRAVGRGTDRSRIYGLFIAGGTFKIVAALSYRFGAWGWILVSGVIDLALGVLIWLEWPGSAFWVLGLFLGISLVFRGFNWIGLGLAVREQPLAMPARP